ncbi:MAG: peptide deformylase [Patescibacteria group bacterium]|nr:peptide deformylase [Patescibacteria group bacterium]
MIVRYPNKILRTKLDEVSNFSSPELKSIIKQMTSDMIKYDGIGIAANQIGVNKKILVINTEEGPKEFINAKIVKKSLIKSKSDEGCLSFPGINGKAKRHKTITVEYDDFNGGKKQICVSGLYSFVFQHEIDHTNGVIFTDRLYKFTEGKKLFKELQKNAKPDEK